MALLGFSGVVVLLNQRNTRKWSYNERGAFLVMIGASATNLFYALTPFVIWEISPSEEFTWRWCSAIGATVNALWVGWGLKDIKVVIAQKAVSIWQPLTLNLIGFLVVTALILNVVGFWGEPRFLPYLVLLVWFLFCSCYFFFRLLFLDEPDSDS